MIFDRKNGDYQAIRSAKKTFYNTCGKNNVFRNLNYILEVFYFGDRRVESTVGLMERKPKNNEK